MKNDLTQDEEALMDNVADQYIRDCLSDLEIDELKLRKGIDFIYSLSDFKSPEVVICRSPMDILIAARKAGAEIKNGDTFDYIGVGYDAGWTAFGDYFRRIGIDFSDIGFDQWLDFMGSHVWASLLYEHVAFVCPGPAKIFLTATGDLHNINGPAIAWKDGFELYFLNGVAVDEELVMTPSEKIDVNIMLKEKNAEVRREIIRKVGIERIVQKLGAERIDKEGDYELLLLDLQDGRKREYLKMRNPSIATYHIEGVPPGTKTVQAALAWRNGRDRYEAPVILT